MQVSKNDNIQIALIGAGGMGQGDTRYAVNVPGVKLVAAADIYDGRLARMKEVYGPGIFTTRDYREVLARPEIDAVIIATPDHWHATITQDALAAKKDIYCEKPMVKTIAEGRQVVEAHKRSDRILQIGSQYASSIVFEKAAQLMKAGAIGELNMVESWLDRNTAVGAWQYSIPPGASPQNVDWDRFLGNAPKRPFEPVRLFRWRNYNDYGTGLAGDLFVHLLTGLHVITRSLGPTRVYSCGGTRFWKDGRDAPDVMLGVLDYPKTANHPAFTFALRVNLACGNVTESFGFRFVGSEGQMTVQLNGLTLSKVPRETEPGYTVDTFSKATRAEFLRNYRQQYPEQRANADSIRGTTETKFSSPPGHSAHQEHHHNFYQAVRSRKPFFEDSEFGLRTAGPSLLTNTSLWEGRACKWDPERMIES
jgi:predicted dehydrogenase